MRFLFLDIDGVLNSGDWIQNPQPIAEDRSLAAFPGLEERRALRSFDPSAVKALNEIVTETQARVVVSSTWGKNWPLPTLTRFLAFHGFAHTLFGCTPDLAQPIEGQSIWAGASRGEEITHWLAMASSILPIFYVILDDDPVTGHGDRLYQTSWQVGLRECDIEPIVRLFR